MGFLLGCLLTLLVGLVFAYVTRPPPPQEGGVSTARSLQVYPSGRRLSTPTELEAPVRVRFLPGIVGEGGSRAEGLEAIVRLHGFLALRDVHSGPTELLWEPAVYLLGEVESDVLCGVDFEDGPTDSLLTSGHRPDPMGRSFTDADDLRVRLRVSLRGRREQIEVWVCSVQGSRRSEVFVGDAGAEGALLRELGTWLASTLGTRDPGSFPAAWGRDPAPRGPALSTYGGLLVESMRTDDLSRRMGTTTSLSEATRIVPEAAWLAAWRTDLPEPRTELLRRAATLRVGFTAALEDLAATWFEEERPALAGAALRRLAREDERRRPVELLLAAWLLDRDQPHEALGVLREMPAAWRTTSAAARLHALARLATSRPDQAARWTRAWIEADPESAGALVAHGNALQQVGRLEEAIGAWRRAARMDARWRDEAVRVWTTAAAAVGREADVVDFLDSLEDSDGVALAPSLIELRAWTALRSDQFVRAMVDFRALSDHPDRGPRARRGFCIAALHAGQADEASCDSVGFEGLRSAQLEGAIASRSTGLLPGWRKDPKEEVEYARTLGPRDPEVAVATLYALATRDDILTVDQEEALARWRVAVGAGVEVPDLPDPEDSPERVRLPPPSP
jgi:tetratricopeptide (TPR) repeat protein